MRQVIYRDLGLIDYKKAWDEQEKLFNSVVSVKLNNREKEITQQEKTKNYLLFCEHPHVFTLGKSGSEENLLANEEQLKKNNATFYKINRGGDITYHGPGQLVVYPIFDLDHFFTDIHKYLRFLEEAVILTLKEYGISTGRIEGLTGVWLDVNDPAKARKICAMGVKCSRWVTMHGIGFNINTQLEYFNHIIPCGISDKQVTSLSRELGGEVNMNELKEKLKLHMANIFDYDYVSE
ncbi:MAG: lipoyl(octanoyl) transferase LipB [Bacteroidota bacterium]